jgi:hypothetical protein
MTSEERERMLALCKQIQDEQDPKKLSQLLEELEQLMDQKRGK